MSSGRAETPAPAQPASTPSSVRRLPVSTLGVAAALVAALWALDRWGLRLQVLTPFGRFAPRVPCTRSGSPWFACRRSSSRLSPQRWSPRPSTLLRGADVPRRLPRRAPLGVGPAPLALFVVREDPRRLGSSFQVYRNEEFYDDALRIDALATTEGRAAAPAAFLRGYVAAMPGLSLHGQHFPPLHALWLYAVRLLFGPGVLVAGASVLVAFAVAMGLVHLASLRLLSEASARQATLLALTSPSMLDFACTSMDAVFLMWAALAWWLALRAASPAAGRRAPCWPESGSQ